MEYLLLIYPDTAMRDALPEAEYDAHMRACLQQTDQLETAGVLTSTRQLAAPKIAKTVRIRNGKATVLDGPFAETKEVLAGFILIQAANLEQALEIAKASPWAQLGCIEVRPARDMRQVRERAGLERNIA